MKFNSKIALAEHIKDLEKSGYLIPQWLEEIPIKNSLKTRAEKVYKVNFKAVQV